MGNTVNSIRVSQKNVEIYEINDILKIGDDYVIITDVNNKPCKFKFREVLTEKCKELLIGDDEESTSKIIIQFDDNNYITGIGKNYVYYSLHSNSLTKNSDHFKSIQTNKIDMVDEEGILYDSGKSGPKMEKYLFDPDFAQTYHNIFSELKVGNEVNKFDIGLFDGKICVIRIKKYNDNTHYYHYTLSQFVHEHDFFYEMM